MPLDKERRILTIYDEDYISFENDQYSFRYYLNEISNLIYIKNYISKVNIVTIPTEFNGIKVGRLEFDKYEESDIIKKIIIPEGLEHIGKYEKKLFSNLQEIIFDGEITLDEDSLRNVLYYSDATKNDVVYTITNSNNYKIEKDCFLSKDGKILYKVLTRFNCVIPNSVEILATGSICGNHIDTATITIPDSVKVVDEIAIAVERFVKKNSLPMNIEIAGSCLLTKYPSPLQIIDNKIIMGPKIKEMTMSVYLNAYKNGYAFVANDNFVYERNCLFSKDKKILYYVHPDADAKFLESLNVENRVYDIHYKNVFEKAYKVSRVYYGRCEFGKYQTELNDSDLKEIDLCTENNVVINENFVIENHMLMSKDKSILYKIFKVDSVIDFEIPSSVKVNHEERKTKSYYKKKDNLLNTIKDNQNNTEPTILKKGTKYSLINAIVADTVTIPSDKFDTKTVIFEITKTCLGIKELIIPEGVTRITVDDECIGVKSRLEIIQLPTTCQITLFLDELDKLDSLMMVIINPTKPLRMYSTQCSYVVASLNKFGIPYTSHNDPELEIFTGVISAITTINNFDRNNLYIDDQAYYYKKSKNSYQLIKARNIDNFVVPSYVNEIKVGSIGNYAFTKITNGRIVLNDKVTLQKSSLYDMHFDVEVITPYGKIERPENKHDELTIETLTPLDVLNESSEEEDFAIEKGIDEKLIYKDDVIYKEFIDYENEKFEKIKNEIINNKDKIKGSLRDYVNLHYIRGLNGTFEEVVKGLDVYDLVDEDQERDGFIERNEIKKYTENDVYALYAELDKKVDNIKAEIIKNKEKIDCSLYEYIHKHYHCTKLKYISYSTKEVVRLKWRASYLKQKVNVEKVNDNAIEQIKVEEAKPKVSNKNASTKPKEVNTVDTVKVDTIVTLEKPIKAKVEKIKEEPKPKAKVVTNDVKEDKKQSPTLSEQIENLTVEDIFNYEQIKDDYKSHFKINGELNSYHENQVYSIAFKELIRIKKELIDNIIYINGDLKTYIHIHYSDTINLKHLKADKKVNKKDNKKINKNALKENKQNILTNEQKIIIIYLVSIAVFILCMFFIYATKMIECKVNPQTGEYVGELDFYRPNSKHYADYAHMSYERSAAMGFRFLTFAAIVVILLCELLGILTRKEQYNKSICIGTTVINIMVLIGMIVYYVCRIINQCDEWEYEGLLEVTKPHITFYICLILMALMLTIYIVRIVLFTKKLNK